MSKGVSTWAGFLALAFGVLGLLAGFTTYAVPVRLERALQRGLVLDEVLAASRAGADLSAFRATLGDSADAVLGGWHVIFAFVLVLQSLPFLSAVAIAILENSRINAFEFWKSSSVRAAELIGLRREATPASVGAQQPVPSDVRSDAN